MLRYFKKIDNDKPTSSSATALQSEPELEPPQLYPALPQESPNINFSAVEYPSDPGLRKNILEYNSNEREIIRRYYLQKGHFQPKNHEFPWRFCANEKHKFRASWFNCYPNWLEYSIAKDEAFCLYCYLFKTQYGGQSGGESFVTEGFKNWRKKSKFDEHVGNQSSIHNKCVMAASDLMKQKQHIETCLVKESTQIADDYCVRLTASIDCIRFLLRHGLPFRGRDESVESSNHGNFLELLRFLADHNENINKVTMDNAPGNLELTSADIQQDIIRSISSLTTSSILGELGDGFFTILVDEACDTSVKEQMAVVLRFVDENGYIVEQFLGIVHFCDTKTVSLKIAIDSLLCQHGLAISSLRGQGYDGASNTRGEFNDLKSLILKENESEYYVHCFAHQLQLTLVAVAENHLRIGTFFDVVSQLNNIVGTSCKRKDVLREKQFEKVVEGIYNGDILTGRGMNQEKTFKRAGTTRWGSYYNTLLSLIYLYSSITDVVLLVEEEGKDKKQRAQANNLLNFMERYEFIFQLHLMKNILGFTNDLSEALQRKDQDIVNVMMLVRSSKQQLQNMRDHGWDSLLNEISLFCDKHKIVITNMEELFVSHGRSRRKIEEKTNFHHYRVETFYEVIDLQLRELNNRFNEVNTELLLCMACFDPSNSFSAYDKKKLVRFAQFYPLDFSEMDLMRLEHQLDNFMFDIRSGDQFSEVIGIGGLAKRMVRLKKHRVYPLVYLLLKLALLLPVATSTVERVFSAMKIIKTSLRNRLGDDMMNDCLVPYIERDALDRINNEDIIHYFQNMKSRRVLL